MYSITSQSVNSTSADNGTHNIIKDGDCNAISVLVVSRVLQGMDKKIKFKAYEALKYRSLLSVNEDFEGFIERRSLHFSHSLFNTVPSR